MVEPKEIHKQLKRLKFGTSLWNQGEIRELPHIIHKGEQISECVNGFYEGGMALLVATEMRLLLIDKKPLNYLTVEDLRFDMINEIDYSHRLMGATITISTGSKTLKFKSYNQARLRHLINLVQEHMSSHKKEQSEKAQTQQQHLEEINKQLQMYLMAQHQQLQQQLSGHTVQPVQAPKPSPQLSDYLFAQRLLEKFHHEHSDAPAQAEGQSEPKVQAASSDASQEELVADAQKEIFGAHKQPAPAKQDDPQSFFTGIEVSPLRIAYSRLPMMLRNRKFGRPSFHDHSQQQRPVAPSRRTVTT